MVENDLTNISTNIQDMCDNIKGIKNILRMTYELLSRYSKDLPISNTLKPIIYETPSGTFTKDELVLVSDNEDDYWRVARFGKYRLKDGDGDDTPFKYCVYLYPNGKDDPDEWTAYRYCMPFNEKYALTEKESTNA